MRPIRARRERYEERDRLFIGQTFPMTSETLSVPVQLVLSASHLSHKSLCSRMNGPLDRLKVLLVIFFFFFCHVAGKTFLVLVDRYSGWPIVSDCGRSATVMVVIRLMKDAFIDKGVPVKLITDGGPQFSSREFKQFCGGWGITHVQSSPHYLQANGAAEAAVKSVKNLIIKSTNRGNVSVDSFREAIIEHRNTPREHRLSPVQMINGRPMRSHVVMHYRTFKPEWQKQINLKRRTRRRHFYSKRLRRTMTNARILSESWTLAGSSVCSPLSPSAGARSPKLLAKINVGGATTLAKKLRQARTSNYRRVHAREITRLCPLARGCPNFFWPGQYIVKSEGRRVVWRNRRFRHLLSGS